MQYKARVRGEHACIDLYIYIYIYTSGSRRASRALALGDLE